MGVLECASGNSIWRGYDITLPEDHHIQRQEDGRDSAITQGTARSLMR